MAPPNHAVFRRVGVVYDQVLPTRILGFGAALTGRPPGRAGATRSGDCRGFGVSPQSRACPFVPAVTPCLTPGGIHSVSRQICLIDRVNPPPAVNAATRSPTKR